MSSGIDLEDALFSSSSLILSSVDTRLKVTAEGDTIFGSKSFGNCTASMEVSFSTAYTSVSSTCGLLRSSNVTSSAK